MNGNIKTFSLLTEKELFNAELRIEVNDATFYLGINKISKNAFMRDQVAFIDMTADQVIQLRDFLNTIVGTKESK